MREKPGYKPICFYIETEKHKELKIKAVQADTTLNDYVADIVLNSMAPRKLRVSAVSFSRNY
jgi:predicted HicB family RNase H-like nuclease